ncbi:uncharacterized protein LOC110904846 [Helianthus annuus]|nr:uncharacterized protein LOC110904846 [Helianthus annuus]
MFCLILSKLLISKHNVGGSPVSIFSLTGSNAGDGRLAAGLKRLTTATRYGDRRNAGDGMRTEGAAWEDGVAEGEAHMFGPSQTAKLGRRRRDGGGRRGGGVGERW